MWSDFRNFVSQPNSEFLSSKCVSEWRVAIKKPADIFYPPFNLAEKNHPYYYFVKLVDSKDFTTFPPVCKKHTQTLTSDPFAPNFVWNLSEFWVFLKSVKIKILFVSAWLLTKSCFCTLPSMGEVMKTERVFISPHFVWKIYPQNSYLANLPCGGKEVKTLASFYLHPTVYLDFYRHFTLKNHQFLPR